MDPEGLYRLYAHSPPRAGPWKFHRVSETLSFLPSQGQAKARPRPDQGQTKARPRPGHSQTTAKARPGPRARVYGPGRMGQAMCHGPRRQIRLTHDLIHDPDRCASLWVHVCYLSG